MGCSNSANPDIRSETVFKLMVKDAIDSNNGDRLRVIYRKYKKINPKDEAYLDRNIVRINGKNLSALAYCVHIGNYLSFELLLKLGSSLQEMNKLLESQGLRAINIICAKNYSLFLKSYLPYYIKSPSSPDKNISYKFEIPLHTAIRLGSIEVITTVFSMYDKISQVPEEFSLGLKNEHGENAAHIACRSGNYNIVKLLHTKFDADFTESNVNNENCLVIAAHGYHKSPNSNFLNIFKYLIEVVGLDVSYMHEEILLKIENEEILWYLEKKLREKGINTTRNELIKCSFTMKGLSLASFKNNAATEQIFDINHKDSGSFYEVVI